MAKDAPKKSSRQGLVSKAMNLGIIALGFSRVIEILFSSASMPEKFRLIKQDATFGLSEGRFVLAEGLRMYSPLGAAVGIGGMKSYLMRKFPVRR